MCSHTVDVYIHGSAFCTYIYNVISGGVMYIVIWDIFPYGLRDLKKRGKGKQWHSSFTKLTGWVSKSQGIEYCINGLA